MAYQYYPGSTRYEATGGALVDGQFRHANFMQPSDLVQHLEQLHSVLGTVSQDSPNIPAHHTLDAGAQTSNNRTSDLAGWIDGMIDELSFNNAGTMAAPQQRSLTEDSLHQNELEASSSHDSSLDTGSSRLPTLHYQNTPAVGNNFLATPQNDASQLNANRATGAVLEQQPSPMGEDEDNGVRLVHSLLACAESIQRGNLNLAEQTLRRIQLLSLPPGPMGKVATHFIDALTCRIYGVAFSSGNNVGSNQSDSLSELLHFHFYETCPYLKFAHFTANQAILEAFAGQKQVHVIDFNLMHGLQWPALIQALALRPGGPPRLRLTGIGPPQSGGSDVLQEIGMKLAQLAETVKVEFEFRGVVAVKLDDIKPWMLQICHGEAVAVNSVFQLHKLLYSAGSVIPIDEVLRSARALKPKIFTIVEHEANHNQPSFLGRFTEALHYYSTMFDSLEACSLPSDSSEQVLAEMYLGREINNIVACEDAARVERHENLVQWQMRMLKAGYRPIQLGLNAFKQASMLLTMFSGDGYRVEEKLGCLTLGWHTRPLISASAWQCA
ncbi:DELLA protein 1 [Physcomitrium patens]|uniref:DELLA protein n=1 Tax=Physcomitrium patens TaxID=3218 RepID=A7U4T7_PHYPA|nr:DELLA protein GAI-like [Physcomitrium patens]ABU63414.1 DELLA protein [Physcomitrium patens]ABX10765.1 DELLA-like protein [Physcomitrium patens]PNR30504.1 hypothetical protein PHYPA_026820 [Physcomitrium patens]|eukprot:XP_024361039.1 DELLA protein GAI-like [Physcomitrella patens]